MAYRLTKLSVETEVTVLPQHCAVKRIGSAKLLLNSYVRRGKVMCQLHDFKFMQLKTDIPFFQILDWTTVE